MIEVAKLENRIKTALDQVRPQLQLDGGDLVFVKFENGIVYIELQGACIGCPFSLYTVVLGIEQHLKNEIAEVEKVITL